MAPMQTQALLNRLLATQYRSLAMYLIYASPWTSQGDERAQATLQHMVDDQKSLSSRIAEYIQQHHGNVELGDFPMEFTGVNDCSLDFLVRKLIELQQATIREIESIVSALAADPRARSLAEETLGAARGHLENLEELVRQTQSAPA